MALVQIADSPSLGEVQRSSTLSRWASRHAAILLLGLVLLVCRRWQTTSSSFRWPAGR